jgi:hypothetical protein
MSDSNTLMHAPMRTEEMDLIETMTQAESFWRELLEAEPVTGGAPGEMEVGPEGPGPNCAWPPLWKFPWKQSEEPAHHAG